MESVLKEDREKLKQLQRNQPRFSEEQKRELGEVHSWVRRGRLPHVINITVSIHVYGMHRTSVIYIA